MKRGAQLYFYFWLWELQQTFLVSPKRIGVLLFITLIAPLAIPAVGLLLDHEQQSDVVISWMYKVASETCPRCPPLIWFRLFAMLDSLEVRRLMLMLQPLAASEVVP